MTPYAYVPSTAEHFAAVLDAALYRRLAEAPRRLDIGRLHLRVSMDWISWLLFAGLHELGHGLAALALTTDPVYVCTRACVHSGRGWRRRVIAGAGPAVDAVQLLLSMYLYFYLAHIHVLLACAFAPISLLFSFGFVGNLLLGTDGAAMFGRGTQKMPPAVVLHVYGPHAGLIRWNAPRGHLDRYAEDLAEWFAARCLPSIWADTSATPHDPYPLPTGRE